MKWHVSVSHRCVFESKAAAFRFLLTVSVLEDDPQGVSLQQLVVVNEPERLHLGVHVTTLLHAGRAAAAAAQRHNEMRRHANKFERL